MKTNIYKNLFNLTAFEEEILSWDENQINDYLKKIDSNVLSFDLFLHNGDNFFIAKHPRFIEVPTHNHDYLELSYVIKGQIIQNISGKEIILKQGDLLILNQHVTHSIEVAGQNDIMLNFLIKPKFLKIFLHIWRIAMI